MNWFRSVVQPLLVLASAKFVKNWQAEYAKFLDINDSKLNLKDNMRHRSVTLNERI